MDNFWLCPRMRVIHLMNLLTTVYGIGKLWIILKWIIQAFRVLSANIWFYLPGTIVETGLGKKQRQQNSCPKRIYILVGEMDNKEVTI